VVSACASLSSEYLDSVRFRRGFDFFVRTVGPRCWSSYVIIASARAAEFSMIVVGFARVRYGIKLVVRYDIKLAFSRV